ncbi:hypothetical protein HDU76_004886 [Blyttiomyces sp. JEL0837]|nr:hypothetical protein HDU76_004886 [Blyttiomyces sp. JEL0837]
MFTVEHIAENLARISPFSKFVLNGILCDPFRDPGKYWESKSILTEEERQLPAIDEDKNIFRTRPPQVICEPSRWFCTFGYMLFIFSIIIYLSDTSRDLTWRIFATNQLKWLHGLFTLSTMDAAWLTRVADLLLVMALVTPIIQSPAQPLFLSGFLAPYEHWLFILENQLIKDCESNPHRCQELGLNQVADLKMEDIKGCGISSLWPYD